MSFATLAVKAGFLCERSVIARRARLVLGALVVFIYFGVGGTASAVISGFLIIAACFASVSVAVRKQLGFEAPLLLLPPWRGVTLMLCAIIGFQFVGGMVNGLAVADISRALVGTLLILALAILIQEAFLRSEFQTLDAFLAGMFALGVGCALVSIFLHWQDVFMGIVSYQDYVPNARLVPFGRGRNPILGAASLSCALFAGLALPRFRDRWQRATVFTGVVVLLVTIMLTLSRGPLLGLIAAAVVVAVVGLCRTPRSRRVWGGLAVTLCFAVPVLMVVLEPTLKTLLCSGDGVWCRETMRMDVWEDSLIAIAQRPFFGFGPDFRFPSEIVNHPHNGLLGMALYFGIPTLLAILWVYVRALARVLSQPLDRHRRFVLMSLAFVAAYYATGQPNVLGDLNVHHLFLWFPLLLSFALPEPDATEPAERA